ncbi:MAG: sulfite exporter TauE/SafE family protein [Ferruginibacter sp.]|nr:sulfite exporter TauE/SafE family protein [Ferruginibacter sp.]
MITLLVTALLMGAVGTFHCIGMCGPLALSLPVVRDSYGSRFMSTLLYNLGRVFTYALIGALLGLAGNAAAIFGFQQALSVLLGASILIFLLKPVNYLSRVTANAGIFMKLRKELGRLFNKKTYRANFFIGTLNGLLPCGLLYMALAGAVSTGTVLKSALFMAAFGLGTLPVMWGLAFMGGFVSISLRKNIRKIYPYIMLFMALLLIVRGLGLDIPYLSPALHNHSQGPGIECHDEIHLRN